MSKFTMTISNRLICIGKYFNSNSFIIIGGCCVQKMYDLIYRTLSDTKKLSNKK